jgi:hypothetical protein
VCVCSRTTQGHLESRQLSWTCDAKHMAMTIIIMGVCGGGLSGQAYHVFVFCET